MPYSSSGLICYLFSPLLGDCLCRHLSCICRTLCKLLLTALLIMPLSSHCALSTPFWLLQTTLTAPKPSLGFSSGLFFRPFPLTKACSFPPYPYHHLSHLFKHAFSIFKNIYKRSTTQLKKSYPLFLLLHQE